MALKAGRVGVNPAQVDELGNIPIPDAYELPKATASKLGGIKVGDRLTVTTGGVLSADAQLPETALADAGKVLTVNEAGTGYELATVAGGSSDIVYTKIWENDNGASTVPATVGFESGSMYAFVVNAPNWGGKYHILHGKFDTGNVIIFSDTPSRVDTSNLELYFYKATCGGSSDKKVTFDKPYTVKIAKSDSTVSNTQAASATTCYAVYLVTIGGTVQ